jgi:hypothetical protein
MMKKVLVLALVVLVSSVSFAGMSWSEDFLFDPDTSATGGWVAGRAGGAPPAVAGGELTWTIATAWTLYDDKNNDPLNDDTAFTAGWLAAPANAAGGVGVWFNFAQDGNLHGAGVNVPIMLGRNGGGQAVIMGNGAPTIQVAEGPIAMTGSFSEATGLMSWAITDSVTTHIGSYTWAFGVPANSQPAGITLNQMANGAGSLDYVTVSNVPEPATLLLLSLGGLVLRKRRKA